MSVAASIPSPPPPLSYDADDDDDYDDDFYYLDYEKAVAELKLILPRKRSYYEFRSGTVVDRVNLQGGGVAGGSSKEVEDFMDITDKRIFMISEKDGGATLEMDISDHGPVLDGKTSQMQIT